MDIGSHFEDDFFEKPKEKQIHSPLNYEPKVCAPLWFMDPKSAPKEASDLLVSLKHQADYQYFKQNYSKATQLYERCIELVPPSNNTWKREFMENLARSHLHLKNTKKALEWSLKLDKFSCSAEQKIVSMNLLAAVCHKLGKFEEELEALHCCIQTHKLCPEFWQRLGLCYAGMFKINLPEYECQSSEETPGEDQCCSFGSKAHTVHCSKSQVANSSICPGLICSESAISCASSTSSDTGVANQDSNDETQDKACDKCDLCTLGTQLISSCLIHTRMLLDSVGPNPLAVDRDKKIKEQIENSLKFMEVDQTFIDEASRALGPDFLTTGCQKQDCTLEQKSPSTK